MNRLVLKTGKGWGGGPFKGWPLLEPSFLREMMRAFCDLNSGPIHAEDRACSLATPAL